MFRAVGNSLKLVFCETLSVSKALSSFVFARTSGPQKPFWRTFTPSTRWATLARSWRLPRGPRLASGAGAPRVRGQPIRTAGCRLQAHASRARRSKRTRHPSLARYDSASRCAGGAAGGGPMWLWCRQCRHHLGCFRAVPSAAVARGAAMAAMPNSQPPTLPLSWCRCTASKPRATPPVGAWGLCLRGVTQAERRGALVGAAVRVREGEGVTVNAAGSGKEAPLSSLPAPICTACQQRDMTGETVCRALVVRPSQGACCARRSSPHSHSSRCAWPPCPPQPVRSLHTTLTSLFGVRRRAHQRPSPSV